MKYPLQSTLLGCLYAAFGLVAKGLRALGWRRALVRRHLGRCLPDVDAAGRRAIESDFYSHLGQLTAEVVAQGFLTPPAFADRVRLENPEALQRVLAAPTGRVLILSSHHANWEWLLQRCSGAFTEPLTAAWKPTPRPAFNRVLCWWRQRCGCQMVRAKELVPHLLAQRGKVRLLAMLADQSPPIKNEQQAWIDFFGQPTSFFRGPGWIGAKMGYSVFLAAMHRERRGHYVVRFVELAPAGAGAEPEQILAAYSAALEAHVRRYPGEYFWAYNRWKREKPLYA
ncbi:MAG: lysophospholipid acyltransferase family protein [Gammaproteobacteria bacterium]|nr:lysophospholipid acyltransferase family protein [Gammaproteobacteria bacterium]MDH5176262.1 lysophospholipid acyltransferase family protein [Gammaproteobacteria bacterium]MDH5227131.1 lysophospholipid acyltransferase family protein [Gammaproteobacteria bacterium]